MMNAHESTPPPSNPPHAIPGPQERREIGARAFMAERQVLKAYTNPEKCRPSVVARATEAARALGYPPPRGSNGG